MKIKITSPLPTSRRARPSVGKTYDVIDTLTVYFIKVNGERVGVLSNECRAVIPLRWEISHPDHELAVVTAEDKLSAFLAAAKTWGVPWTTIAKTGKARSLGPIGEAQT